MGWDLPCVVARLRGTFDITGKLRTIPDDKKPPEIGPDTKVYARRATYIKPPLDESKQHAVPFDDSIEHIGEADPDSVEYPGPRHLMLSLSAWLIATKQGCMSCGNPLHPRTHAWSLQWVETDQGVKPICDSCIDIKSAEDDEIVTQGGG
jgi:hypothetical protein